MVFGSVCMFDVICERDKEKDCMCVWSEMCVCLM